MRIEKYLEKRLSEKGVLHFSLIDPEKARSMDVSQVARALERAGSDAILIGGSTGVMQNDVDMLIDQIREACSLPTIIFPGGVSNISSKADAILFMSLLNSSNPFYIIGAQMLGAPIVRKYGLEALPTAYLIIGYGGAAGYVGEARPIPYEKPELTAAYAMAAELLGMRYVYLEAGSGAPRPVPIEHISLVRRSTRLKIIVGGGIRGREEAFKAAAAGADIVVTGTIIEGAGAKLSVRLREIIGGLRDGYRERASGKG